MRPYELIVLLHPDLEIDVDTPVSKIEKMVQQLDGKVLKKDNWGKRRLAYRVRKQDFAVYVYFELSLPTSAVRELENTILITEEVIRHLLVSQISHPAKEPAKTAAVKEDEKPKDKVEEEK